MALDWSRHRFSGGVLIYDLINTVVHRSKSELRTDHLADLEETTHFAKAARKFRNEEVQTFTGTGAITETERVLLLELRETAYFQFQNSLAGLAADRSRLPGLLRVIAQALDERSNMPFAADAALSALYQTAAGTQARLKTCPSCDWLFVDKSKNGSRVWCDMAVCGNRQKARLSYARRS
jgi:predicted RNA-binding Zn ribbon-like protein